MRLSFHLAAKQQLPTNKNECLDGLRLGLVLLWGRAIIVHSRKLLTFHGCGWLFCSTNSIDEEVFIFLLLFYFFHAKAKREITEGSDLSFDVEGLRARWRHNCFTLSRPWELGSPGMLSQNHEACKSSDVPSRRDQSQSNG